MLLDEDIQLKMQNARALMIEDIENALKSAEENIIELENPCYLDEPGFDMCDEFVLNEYGIGFYNEIGFFDLRDLDYEQLHTVYEALKSEGYFIEKN